MVDSDYSLEIFNKHYETFDPTEDNCDVYVRFKDGTRHVATLFTVNGIQKVMTKDSRTGESASGTYFWCTDLLIVNRIDEESVKKTVDSLIEEECFETVFSLCKPDSDEMYNQFDTVKIIKLIDTDRWITSSDRERDTPRISDTGTIVHVKVECGSLVSYVVEKTSSGEESCWVADFLPEEVERIQEAPHK